MPKVKIVKKTTCCFFTRSFSNQQTASKTIAIPQNDKKEFCKAVCLIDEN